MRLVLASSSPYRASILKRLGLPFDQMSPDVSETPKTGEEPIDLVLRLAREKALAVAERAPGKLIIASDQVAVFGKEMLGKPKTLQRAITQLKRFSGQTIHFLTSVAVYNPKTGHCQQDVATTEVTFRRLDEKRIRNYLVREEPFDCAGSFKSEGLGAALLSKVVSDDPDALVGLPLLRLVKMLAKEGIDPLSPPSDT